MKRDAESVKRLQIEFLGDRFVVRLGDDEFLSGRFSVDDNKNPRTLDLEAIGQDGDASTIPAIYKINEEGLRICHPNKEGGGRPSVIKSSEEVVLLTFSKQE
ncbi:MAG: TIGR03067 domain-containing protein [Verrucomicrobiales bacterium]